MASAPEALDDIVPVLALCPSVLPMTLTHFLDPNDSIQRCLTAALPLVLAPDETPVVQPVPVSPVVTANSRKHKITGKKTSAGTLGTTPKTPRKRSSYKPSADHQKLPRAT